MMLPFSTLVAAASSSASSLRRASSSASLAHAAARRLVSLPTITTTTSSSSSSSSNSLAFLPSFPPSSPFSPRRWRHTRGGKVGGKAFISAPAPPPRPSSFLRGRAAHRMDIDALVEGEKEGGKAGGSGTSGELQQQQQQHQQADFLNDFLGLPAECVAVARPQTETADASYVSSLLSSDSQYYHPNPVEEGEAGGGGGGGREGGEGESQAWRVVDPRAPIVEQNMFDVTPFVEMFRNSAPYISMHRGAVMVLHLPGDLIGTPAFEKTLDDVTLMSLLGVKIVIVCGIAYQIDRRLRDVDAAPKYCGDVRITDADTLRIVKEEAGFARCEVESILSRGFKGRPGAMGINVVGGNFFYSAKPFGVIDGIDFGYTGEVRKIETENIIKRLNQGDVVLLSTLGYSASGQ
ncbi:hypothetical protein VYU27_008000, partial [Nannochloropsis oceanica]